MFLVVQTQTLLFPKLNEDFRNSGHRHRSHDGTLESRGPFLSSGPRFKRGGPALVAWSPRSHFKLGDPDSILDRTSLDLRVFSDKGLKIVGTSDPISIRQ